jgi:adenylate cyclase
VEKIKNYLIRNFEQFFVFIILAAIVAINYFIPQKIAFLNFYFLPVIIAGYLLGLHRSVMGALLCVLLVAIYAILYPHQFTTGTRTDLYLHILTWGCFLILAGAVVGKQQEKLNFKIRQAKDLNEQLELQKEELNKANIALRDYSENLEAKVRERTEALENSNQAIESLKVKVEDTLYSTMDSAVAKLIIEGRIRNEKRKVSVMFSDLVGFTTYSEERSPELVVRDLNRYLSDMEPVILDYHGHIDKYLGDGIMCEFGAPLDYETYRLLAVLAAFKMQEKMARLDYPWQMRIGIASGDTIMGLIGSKRQSYTTIGDVVNLSSRLETSCPPGSVLIDGITSEGVNRFFDLRLKRDLPLSEVTDIKKEAELESLHEKLLDVSGGKEKSLLHYQIGQLHMSLGEIYDAVNYFERALQIRPDDVALKVAFAEATMKRDELKKLKVKGRKQRVPAYEVLGLKDVLLDRNKFTPKFYEKYDFVKDLVKIPEDVILPVESLDGSIGHSKVVAVLSYAIATELGVSETEKREILHAGFVADIGKVIIPHHLLNRQGGLSDTEIREVAKHPVEGPRILKQKGYDSELMLSIVRHSHENFNGSGYPDGKREDGIPIGSRIVAVADAYDALTSWRPYRERWDRKAAFYELKRGVETGLYDPQIVQSLVKAMI